jgi:hypothetical protein
VNIKWISSVHIQRWINGEITLEQVQGLGVSGIEAMILDIRDYHDLQVIVKIQNHPEKQHDS